MTKTSEKYASDDELEWFDIEKYAPLAPSPKSPTGSMAHWAQLIRDRIQLEAAIDGYLKPSNMTDEERKAYFQQCATWMESIKSDPTKPLGFGQTDRIAYHSSNTPTVKLLTGKRLVWLCKEFVALNPTPLFVDIGFAEPENNSEYPFDKYVHVMVNTNATNETLEKDFAVFIRKYRDIVKAVAGETYEEKLKQWHRSGVMAFKDLTLFEKLSGKSIRWDTKIGLITLINDDDLTAEQPTATQDKSRYNLIGKHARRIFTQATCELLENSA